MRKDYSLPKIKIQDQFKGLIRKRVYGKQGGDDGRGTDPFRPQLHGASVLALQRTCAEFDPLSLKDETEINLGISR